MLFPFFSPFLKAKAVIYRPFRFAECSLFELHVQTPPKREGGAGVAEETPRRGKPCAAEGPGTPPPRDHAAPQGRRTRTPLDSKAQICPPPRVLSRTDPADSPPSPALKGPAKIQLPTAGRGEGARAPSAGGSTDRGPARGASPRGVQGGTPSSPSSACRCSHLPLGSSLSPPDFLAFKERVKKRETVYCEIVFE